MLTAAANRLQSPQWGGDFMKGSYHYQRDRYYVNIYWDGKPNRIWRYNGEPIWHENTAKKLLTKIRTEIDER